VTNAQTHRNSLHMFALCTFNSNCNTLRTPVVSHDPMLWVYWGY